MHKETRDLQQISIVVPVYLGEKSLPILLKEIEPFMDESETPKKNKWVIEEVILVHDCGGDNSHITIQELCDLYEKVTVIWLTKNYGQHAATMAGMASAKGDFVVTMDEDGQQNPSDLPMMIDCAIINQLQVVYAEPINNPPHGLIRNIFSSFAKKISCNLLGNDAIKKFNSYRLIDGEVARTLAAYCGNGVYLDVGLSWIVSRVGFCNVLLREEYQRRSGYSSLKLIGHFWRLVITSGTRPLRIITMTGIVSIMIAFAITIYAVYGKYAGVPVQGWASLLIVVAFFSGAILASLGVIAEYLAVTTGIVMGKPLYVISNKPVSKKNEN